MRGTLRLDQVAVLNPRLTVRPADNAIVSFLGMADVGTDGSTTIGDDRPFSEAAKGYTQFRRGDVLVAKITPCFENGKIAQARTRHMQAAGSTEFHVVRPNPEILDERYLHHYLRQPLIRIEGERRMTGSGGQRRVPKSYLGQLQIPVPPIKEQQRIAGMLDWTDELRAKRRQAIGLLDDLTQSTFLDMFGDPLANPKEWPIRTLSEFFSAVPTYGTMTPSSTDVARWVCIRVANIQNWELSLQDKKLVDLESSRIAHHTLVDGDVILARAIATQEHLGKAVVVYPGDENWAFDSHLMRLRLDSSRLIPEYLQTLLRTRGGRRMFLSVTRRSSVQYNINTKEIARLQIPVPEIAVQMKFLRQMTEIKRHSATCKAQLVNIEELFSSLKAKAFRGEL